MERVGTIDNVLQRCVFLIIQLVVQNGMAMEKGTTATVLPYESHVVSVYQQRCVSHGLGETPVHSRIARYHFGAFVHNALHTALRSYVRRNGRYRFTEVGNGLRADCGIGMIVPLRIQKWCPIDRKRVSYKTQRRLGNRLAAVESITIVVLQLCYACQRRDLPVDQSIRVKLPSSFMSLYSSIHDRLSRRRFVRLIVAMAPIANQIDNHVFLESLPVHQCKP